MVIDKSRSLHMSINDRGAHELEASRLEVLAQLFGLGACRRYLALHLPTIDERFAADETPDVVGEAPEFFLDREIVPRVADRCLDLSPVAYDAGVGHEPFNGALVEARNALGIEVGKCAAITGTLAQNRCPAQAGLRAFEDQKLEVRAIVVHGNAPFGVVVAQVVLVDALTPWTSSLANGLVVRCHSDDPVERFEYTRKPGTGKNDGAHHQARFGRILPLAACQNIKRNPPFTAAPSRPESLVRSVYLCMMDTPFPVIRRACARQPLSILPHSAPTTNPGET